MQSLSFKSTTRQFEAEEIPHHYFCYRATREIVDARDSTRVMTHQGSKACSQGDATDHRWLRAAAWPQSRPGLSGFCRGSTGSSKGRHSEAQRVASRSPWTSGAPRWPACEQGEKGVRRRDIQREHHRGLGCPTAEGSRGR